MIPQFYISHVIVGRNRRNDKTMGNNKQNRGCIAPVVYVFFVAWICYGLFFAVGLWLTRSFYWQHVLAFAGTMAVVTTIAVHFNEKTASPTAAMLVQRVSKEDIERKYAEYPAWQELKQELQKGDQIWLWAAFGYTWMALGDRYGYVIVREGKPTEHFMFIEETEASR